MTLFVYETVNYKTTKTLAFVIPAEAGILGIQWADKIPASAGMTPKESFVIILSPSHPDPLPRHRLVK